MQNGAMILRVFEPMRGGPIELIGPGDLAEPRGPTIGQRVVDFVHAVVEVACEARELERRLVARGGRYVFRES